MPPHVEELHGGRLLASDARTAYILLNEARARTIERLFGVPRAQQGLATLVALGLVARVVHAQAKRLRVLGPPHAPTSTDAVFGGAMLRELARGVAGPSSRATPLFGTLVVIGVVGGLARPALGRSVRGIRALSHSFQRRYGHLVERRRRG